MSRVLTSKSHLAIERANVLQRVQAKKHARIFVRLHDEDTRALRSSASMIPTDTYHESSRSDYDITLINKLPLKSSHAAETSSILEHTAEETQAFKFDLHPPSLVAQSESGVLGARCLVESAKLHDLRRNLLVKFCKLWDVELYDPSLPKGLGQIYNPSIMLRSDIQQYGAERRLSALIRSRQLPSRPLLVGLGAEIYSTQHKEAETTTHMYSFPWDWNKKNIRRAMKRGGLLPW